MASLLSFASNALGRIGNTVNNDVVQPVLRAAPAPVRGVANAVSSDVSNFAAPAIHAAAALNPVGISYNAGRLASGLLTGNRTAAENAVRPYAGAAQNVRNLAQGTAAQVLQLGESVNPLGGNVYNRQFTPTGPLQRAVLGSNPIPSIQKQYQQNKQAQGGAYAATQATVTALMDTLGAKQGAEGGVNAIRRAPPLYAAARNKLLLAKAESPSPPKVGPKTISTSSDGTVKPGKGSEQIAKTYFANKPQATADYQAHTMQEFGTKIPNVVSGDSAKFIIKGGQLRPEDSAPFHEPASQFAKGYYKQLLADQTTKDKPVLITGGGAGAGKTSGLNLMKQEGTPLENFAAINDTNLTNLKSATDRIAPALASGRKVIVQYTYRDPVEAFTKGNLTRAETTGRIVSIAQHVDTHIGSLKTIQQIAEKYKGNPNVEVRIVDNTRGKGGATFAPNGVDFLKNKGYNGGSTTLRKVLVDELNNAKTHGTVRPEAYAAYREGLQPNDLKGTGRPNGQVSSPKPQPQRPSELAPPRVGVKPTRFTEQTIPKSSEVSPQVKEKVGATYTPGTNVEKLAASNKLVGAGLDKATTQVTDALSKEKGSLMPQEVSDAIAVAKAHDAAGNFDTATNIYNRLAEHGTAAGQKIQALSLLSNRTPQGLLYSALKTLQKAGVDTTGKLGEQIRSHIDEIKAADPGSSAHDQALQKLIDTVNQNIPRGRAEAFAGIWRAGLLTGPETVAKVIASSVISNPIEAAAKPVAAGIDKALTGTGISDLLQRNVPGHVPGARSNTFGLSDIGVGAKGAVRGGAAIPAKLRTGLDAQNTGGFQKGLGEQGHQTPYERFVNRVHGSFPKIPYAALHDATLHELARTQAINEGLSGADRTARMSQLELNPPASMEATAKLAGERGANTEDTAFGRGAQALQQFKAGPVPVGKFIAPFSRVPGAIATKGIIDYTPVGLAKGAVQGIYNGVIKGTLDQRALNETLARGTVGTGAAVILGAKLMHSGNMTLSAPTDPKEKALWLAEGKQANSIKVGGKWISLNAFGPFGIAMGLGAGFQRGIDSGAGIQGAASQSVASAGKLVAAQPYVKGIAGLANAFNDPTRYAQQFYDSTLGSIIPAAVSQTARGTDTTSRAYTPGVTSTLKGEIPGARETLPAQTNIFGQKVAGANPSGTITGGILGTVNPFYPQTPINNNDQVTQELQRLYNTQGSSGPSIAQPTSLTIEGNKAKANSQNINVLNSTAGPVIHSTLAQMINSPTYQGLPDANKTAAINTVLTAAKSNAESQIATSFKLSPPKKGGPVPTVTNLSAATPNTSKALQTQQDKIDQQNFVKSGKAFQVIGDNVWLANPKNPSSPTHMTQVDYQYAYDDKALTSYKDAGNLNSWMSTAQDLLGNIQKQLADPNANPLNVLSLQNKASTIQTDIAKYASYGGFSKGSGSSAKPKIPNFKTGGGAALKAPKVKSISAKGGKSAYKAPKVAKAKTPSFGKGGFKAGRAPKTPNVGVAKTAPATGGTKKSPFGEA